VVGICVGETDMGTKKPRKKPDPGMLRWHTLQRAKRAALARPTIHMLSIYATPRWFHQTANKLGALPGREDGLVTLTLVLRQMAEHTGVVWQPVRGALRPVSVRRSK
jgi:hypothetical protein